MSNNKYFTISYEEEGSKRIDTIMIWSNSITNAIKEFTNTEFNCNGFIYKYSEYAIKNIEC
jgi:hypothetical protein